VSVYHGGACFNTGMIEVIDLWNRRTTTLALDADDELTAIQRMASSSNSVLQYKGETQSESDCRQDKQPRPLNGSANVSPALFR